MGIQKMLEFLEAAVGAPYVYGGTGKLCTPDYRRARAAQYPAMAGNIRKFCPVLSGKTASCGRCKYKGRPAYDCAQLVKAAFKAAGVLMPSGATSQWKAKAAWAYQGRITGAAARHVCVLFRQEADGKTMAHAGISLGNGFVIDARGHAVGVIKSRLTAYPWTHMAVPRGFPVPDALVGKEPESPAPQQPLPAPDVHSLRLAVGDRGQMVRLLQTQLIRLGYPLPRYGADGIYGRETACAVVAFQKVTGLLDDGTAGPDTMKRLFPKLEPKAQDNLQSDEEYALSFTM
ncbi:MAG TPA: hypothetical protein GX006_00315 [Clostridiales bacterium]|nr:hypothetical protein [Clostridiales bacterium]